MKQQKEDTVKLTEKGKGLIKAMVENNYRLRWDMIRLRWYFERDSNIIFPALFTPTVKGILHKGILDVLSATGIKITYYLNEKGKSIKF